MGFIDKLGKAAQLVFEHGDSISHLLHDNFTGEAIEHVRDRKMMVSQESIRLEIEKIEEAKPWLKFLRCEPDGIELELEGKRYGGTFSAKLHLRVDKMTLTDQEQSLMLRIVEETTTGRDIWGKVLCGVGSVLMGSFIKHAFETGNLKQYAEYDETGRVMSIRLGKLELVQKMLEPKIPRWPDSAPLCFLGADGCEHVAGGILINLAPSPLFERYREQMRNLCAHNNKTTENKPRLRERAQGVADLMQEHKDDARALLEIGQKAIGVRKNFLNVFRP